jgi:hypothetical protein
VKREGAKIWRKWMEGEGGDPLLSTWEKVVGESCDEEMLKVYPSYQTWEVRIVYFNTSVHVAWQHRHELSVLSSISILQTLHHELRSCSVVYCRTLIILIKGKRVGCSLKECMGKVSSCISSVALDHRITIDDI